jgi:hypothetical protein
MIIHSPIISGSLTFADGGTLSLPNPTAVSGSFSGSAQFSTIGSHIIPDTANTYDLGSTSNYFRDLYISTGSLKAVGNGAVSFKLGGKPGGGLKITDDNDDDVDIQVQSITLKDTSGNGNNIKLRVQNGALKSNKSNNAGVDQSDDPQLVNQDISGSLIVSGSTTLADASVGGTLGVTGTSTLGVVNASGLISADGGLDVDGAFTVADSTGNVVTTGTLSAGNTNVGTLDASGLASLDGGIDVDGAFTVADSSGNVSTSGTLGVTGTSTLGVINASGLLSADAGIDVDGAFTVADSTGNVSTSGTLGVTGLSTLGAVTASGMDVAGHILPAAHNTYDLGSSSRFWRDLYLSSGSLYINGIQVLSTDGTDLTIQTDAGESTKILETGNDTITLETANGDITLTSSGAGQIELDAPIQINAGKNILSSDGNAISITDDVTLGSNRITAGNITLGSTAITATGTEINLLSGLSGTLVTEAGTQTLTNKTIAASQVTEISNLTAAEGEQLENIGTTTISAAQWGYLGGLTATDTELNQLDDVTVGGTSAGDIVTIDGSQTLSNKTIAASQVTEISNLTTAEGAQLENIGTTTISSTQWGYLGASDQGIATSDDVEFNTLTLNGTAITATATELNYTDGVSSNIQTQLNNLSGTDIAITLTGDATGSGTITNLGDVSFATTLAGTFAGDKTFSNNVVISGNLTVSGTTTSVNSNEVNIGDNVIVLNSDETGTPSQNGGLEIERGTATNASILWDEGNDYWVSGLAGAEERIVVGAGNTSITTLGTIATGVWNGTAITHDYIGLDAIDGTNISDNAINSEHYTDGSIDRVHLAADIVDGTKIADDAIDSEHYADGSIDTAHIAADAVTYAKIQNVSATNRILGRDSAGAGVIEEITPANLRTMINVEDGATADQTAAEIRTAVGTGNNGVIPAEGTAGHFLKHDGTFGLPSYTTNTDTNTQNTYSVSIPAATTKLRLSGAGHDGSTTDDIEFVGSGATTVTRTDADTFTISSTDTNTNTQNTTTLSFVDSSNDIILRNTTGGAGSGTQDIKLVAGSNITLTHTDANNFTIASTDTNTQLSTADVRGKFSAGTGITISSGEISIGQAVGTGDDVTFASVSATGDIVAYASSDERLKDNIEVISNPIEKVQQLKGVTWDWNDKASEIQHSLPNVGVIAQDVEKVLPQLVKDRDNGYKGVDYDKIVGLLIEAIKDQQTQIDELKSKIG